MTPEDQTNPAEPSFFRALVKSVGLYGLAIIVQRMAAFVLIPVTTRNLAVSDYGVLEMVEQLSSILSILMGYGFASALGYFYHLEKSPEWRRRVNTTTLLGSGLVGLVAALAGFLLSTQISQLAFGDTQQVPYLQMAFAVLPLLFVVEALFGWLRIEDRPTEFVWASALRVGLVIVATILLVGFLKLRIWGVLFSTATSTMLVVLAISIYAFPKLRPISFDWHLFRRMFNYSIALSFSLLAMFTIHYGDRFILARTRSLEELGLYSLAYKVAMLLSFAFMSFQNYWSAKIFQLVQREDAKILFARVFTYVMAVTIFLAVGLVVITRPMLKIFAGPAFQDAAAIVPLLVLAYVIRSVGDFFRPVFLTLNRPGAENLCNWCGTVVCVAGYIAWIPEYGIWGAATATLLAFIAIGIVSLVWVHKVWPYQLESARLFKIILAAAFLIALYFGVSVHLLAGQLIWAGFLLACYPALLWIMRFQTPAEIDLVLGYRAAIRRTSQP